MSKDVSARWTCDRCGAVETTNPGTQPSRWSSVIVVTPVEAVPDTDHASPRKHLCLQCVRRLGDFLAPRHGRDDGAL